MDADKQQEWAKKVTPLKHASACGGLKMADRKIVKARKCRVCEEWIRGTAREIKEHSESCEGAEK